MLKGQNQNREWCNKGKENESGPIKSGNIVKKLRIEPDVTLYKIHYSMIDLSLLTAMYASRRGMI